MKDSKIEWTTHTANLWWGCTKVHEGCDNCYAETLANRWGVNVWGNDKPRKEIKSVWRELDKMQQAANKAGEMQRVFVGSMMDIFEKPMNVVNSKGEQVFCNSENTWELNTGLLRDELFNNIDLRMYDNLIFLLLTKRPSNINKYIPSHWKETPPENVMFGTSPVNQETANKLIPQLLQVNGKKFLSIEPMLDKIVLQNHWIDKARFFDLIGATIDWIIVGGESGHNKRPFNPDWARQIRDDCKGVGIPFFMKQIDKKQPIPEDLMIREFPVM